MFRRSIIDIVPTTCHGPETHNAPNGKPLWMGRSSTKRKTGAKCNCFFRKTQRQLLTKDILYSSSRCSNRCLAKREQNASVVRLLKTRRTQATALWSPHQPGASTEKCCVWLNIAQSTGHGATGPGETISIGPKQKRIMTVITRITSVGTFFVTLFHGLCLSLTVRTWLGCYCYHSGSSLLFVYYIWMSIYLCYTIWACVRNCAALLMRLYIYTVFFLYLMI